MTRPSTLPPPPEDIIELALPDGPLSPAEDRDPFCSKLGGSPAWLITPTSAGGNPACPRCQTEMYLILQMDCPREDLTLEDGRAVDRVVYVFACNTRTCSQSPEGWRVIFQSRAAKEAIKESSKEATKEAVNFWDSLMNEQNSENKASKSSETKETCEIEETKETQETQTETTLFSIDNRAAEHSHHFPPLFLHIEEEIIVPSKKSTSKAVQTIATPEEDWSGEQYEKFMAPGTDKSFNKFQKRVANYPRQCVRYTVAVGSLGKRKDPHAPPTALPFRDCDWQEAMSKLPGCTTCAQPCTRFELQLMPAVLAFLPCESSAHLEHIPAAKRSQNPLISDGMEWGSVFVFTCDGCLLGSKEGRVLIQLE